MTFVPPALRVPLTFLLLMAVTRRVSGEFWRILTFDPDYVYLLNAQALAQGGRIGHIDHPGTPVQMLGALLLRLMRVTDETAIAHPELYLNILAAVCCLLLAAALWWFGTEALRAGFSPAAAMAAQAAPLVSAQILMNYTARFNPEPVVMALGIAVAAVLLRQTAQPGKTVPTLRSAVVCGALTGVALASKLSFLGVALGMTLAFPPVAALAYLATALGSALVAITPIWERLPELLHWMSLLATHRGNYASGGEGLLHPALFAKQVPLLLLKNPAVAAALALSAYALWRSRGETDPARKLARRILLGTAAALLIGWLLASKYTLPQYVAPALSFTGIAVLLAARLSGVSRSACRRVSVLVAVIFAGNVAWSSVTLLDKRAEHVAVTNAASEYPDCLVIGHFPVSHPAYALAFGDGYAHGRFARLWRERYPYFVENNYFQGFYRAGEERADPAQFLWRRGCVYEIGDTGPWYKTPPGTVVKHLISGKFDEFRLLGAAQLPVACEARPGDGWYGVEPAGATQFQWARQDAFIVIASPDERDVEVSALQMSAEPDTRVDAWFNGKPIGFKQHRNGVPEPVRYQFRLQPGFNRLWLHGDRPGMRPPADARDLAFRWQGIEFKGDGCAWRPK